MAVTKVNYSIGYLTSSFSYRNDDPQMVIVKDCPSLLQSHLSNVVINEVSLPYLNVIKVISDHRASLQTEDKGVSQRFEDKYTVLNLKIVEKFISSTGGCVIAKIAISFSSEALSFLKNTALYSDLEQITIEWINEDNNLFQITREIDEMLQQHFTTECLSNRQQQNATRGLAGVDLEKSTFDIVTLKEYQNNPHDGAVDNLDNLASGIDVLISYP